MSYIKTNIQIFKHEPKKVQKKWKSIKYCDLLQSFRAWVTKLKSSIVSQTPNIFLRLIKLVINQFNKTTVL